MIQAIYPISYLLLLCCLMGKASCQASSLGQERSTPPTHELFDALLKKHVSSDGRVNYTGFIAEKETFQIYLDKLSNNAPDRNTWSREEQLAYWINAYNAFTIKLIIDNYPVSSIQDLKPTLNIPLVNTVWHLKFFKIGGEDASLDEIEHKILRKEFDEPRIHFAINCASFSCPPLLNEAFTAENLEAQLDKVAKGFINDPKRNKIARDKVEISKIFSWFKGDFTKNESLIEYLNRYAQIKINANAKVSHLPYDWSLNE
ncbi:DUF547 domain-containing protein [Lunatibacter salilacus]|uniref:DUF547 domain-containing protein n=1 Tax=Lunatibacter salilacus TaxID=2483804 RepID=UPI00131E15D6